MALSAASVYAQQLVDEMDDLDPDGFGAQDADVHTKVKSVLGTALVRVMLQMFADADVSFGAGTIVGVDAPSGDTHNGLSASNGTIS